jgi:hypothetical protein
LNFLEISFIDLDEFDKIEPNVAKFVLLKDRGPDLGFVDNRLFPWFLLYSADLRFICFSLIVGNCLLNLILIVRDIIYSDAMQVKIML